MIQIPMKVRRKVKTRALRVVNAVLGAVESRPLKSRPGRGLIFVIGPPRSGTTLLYQLLVKIFDVGYISNRHAAWFGGISFFERLAGRSPAAGTIDFVSQHGGTSGSDGPSECGEYWYRFFPKSPQYVADCQLPGGGVQRLQNSLGRISRAFGKPVLFKNVLNSGRLKVLSRMLPEAVFIEMVRDPVGNAHSILAGRKRVNGSYEAWWSIEPLGYEAFLNAPPEVQAYEQVRLTQQMIARDAPLERRMQVRYEELCDNPVAAMKEAEDFFELNRMSVARRAGAAVPVGFARTTEISIPSDLYERLVRYSKNEGN